MGHVARGGSHSCHAHMQKIAGGGSGYILVGVAMHTYTEGV